MGCFDMTCAFSGLPITGGEKVIYFLLTQSPYDDKASACYVWDRWFPRTFPLKATYNHYGSVDRVEEGPMREVWLEGLQKDLYEVGLGENYVHDVPVRKKDLSFEQVLEAVWEGRLLVERDLGRTSLREVDEKLGIVRPKVAGVPDLQCVESALQAAGLPVARTSEEVGYLVDEACWGRVVVRYCAPGAGLGPAEVEKRLEAASEAVGPGFARAVWAARDYGASPHGDLEIRPRIGTPDFHGPGHSKDPRPLRVSQALVRQDVWDLLMRHRIFRWDDKVMTLRKYEEGVGALWAKVRASRVRSKMDLMFAMLRGERDKDPDTGKELHGSGVLTRSLVPFTMGPAEHAKLLLEREDLDHGAFVRRAAEFSFFLTLSSSLHVGFRPSEMAGQEYRMRPWVSLLRGTADLAERIAWRCEGQRRRWDAPRRKRAAKKK